MFTNYRLSNLLIVIILALIASACFSQAALSQCTVNITGDPVFDQGSSTVSVSGTVQNCGTDTLVFVVQCNGKMGNDQPTILYLRSLSGYQRSVSFPWNVTIPLTSQYCKCGANLCVTVACRSAIPECKDIYCAPIKCDTTNCPEYSLYVSFGDCVGSKRNVTLLAVALEGAHEVKWNYGDGSMGSNFTLEQAILPDLHQYEPRLGYRATLIDDAGCTKPIDFDVAECGQKCPTGDVTPYHRNCIDGNQYIKLEGHYEYSTDLYANIYIEGTLILQNLHANPIGAEYILEFAIDWSQYSSRQQPYTGLVDFTNIDGCDDPFSFPVQCEGTCCLPKDPNTGTSACVDNLNKWECEEMGGTFGSYGAECPPGDTCKTSDGNNNDGIPPKPCPWWNPKCWHIDCGVLAVLIALLVAGDIVLTGIGGFVSPWSLVTAIIGLSLTWLARLCDPCTVYYAILVGILLGIIVLAIMQLSGVVIRWWGALGRATLWFGYAKSWGKDCE